MIVGRLLSIVVATLCSVAALADLKVEQVRDPHYGHALFEFYQEDYFAAIVELLAADTMDRLPNHGDDGELLLGGLYLSYGLHDAAAAIFDRLLAERTDEGVRNRTWFFIGKIRYQRGYPEKALEALSAIRGELPEELEPERRMMHSQVLMQLGRYDEAAAVLDRWKGPDDWYHFASYNLGVALIRAGKVAVGAERLEDIGARRGPDREELFSLQDKANVALGYAYLQNERPVEARSVLQRVRLDGPFSNKALLGVGWADAELGNYRRALVPWLELRGRDLLDSAVQESLLAIPYAYGKLAANSEAASQYLLAIESYVDETRRLDDAIGRIESGELVDELLSLDAGGDVGWFWQLDEVPDSYESRYLYHLLAGHEFQEALKNFRDLRSLRKNLTAWRDSADVFDSMLDTREQAFTERLPAALALLGSADMDALQTRREALTARLDGIEAGGDTIALAPEADVELWQEVAGYGTVPALGSDLPQAADARAKLRLLRGVLLWEADKSFPARVWRQRKNLRDVDLALEQSRDLRDLVTRALSDEPENFTQLRARVDSLVPRIDALLADVNALAARQQHEVNRIAVTELTERKRRLDTYTVQARYALASIYDQASQRGAAGAGE